jgi:hypothetical protein
MAFIWFKRKFNCFEFRSYWFISSTFHLFINSYYFYLNMPRKTRHLINLTSKLQVSPNFAPDSVADRNYRGKCNVGGFSSVWKEIKSMFRIQKWNIVKWSCFKSVCGATGQRRDRSLPRPTWLPDGRSWVNSSSMSELGSVCRRLTYLAGCCTR